MPSDLFLHIKENLCWCGNRPQDRPESELVEELTRILATNPDLVHEIDENHMTLLHCAAQLRSIEFCQLLIGKNGANLRLAETSGMLPFHTACYFNNPEATKYLFQLYPESIDISDSYGDYPIHFLQTIMMSNNNVSELTEFLLNHDRGAVMKHNNRGLLPLHLAIERLRKRGIIKLLFNAYPEAILQKCGGRSFLEYVRQQYDSGRIASFFESQLDFIHQSKYDTTPDENGQLPIHRILHKENLPSGTVYLMAKANPASLTTADNQGRIPLHIAVKHRDLSIVRQLIQANHKSLQISDLRGNCALHYACLAGNYNIISCILDKFTHGASTRNFDHKLPIQLLMYDAECNRDSLEYMGAVHGLLFAYPNVRDIAFEQMFERIDV